MKPTTNAPCDELKSFVRLQALKVSQDRFRSDSESLITAVDRALKGARAERRKRVFTPPGKRIWLSFAGAVAGLALVAAFSIYLSSHPLKQATPKLQSRPFAEQSPAIVATSPAPSEEQARRFLKATKDHPWVNSLGMKFVPVAGTQVLFSVWDTRVRDFEAFVKSTGYDATGGMFSLAHDGWKLRGATWEEPGFRKGANHPVGG